MDRILCSLVTIFAKLKMAQGKVSNEAFIIKTHVTQVFDSLRRIQQSSVVGRSARVP